jgi:hypothetical protein
VEVAHGGVWGTICDDGWNDGAASVVCRQLGYDGGTSFHFAAFGAAPEGVPYHMDDVVCTGNETSISDCQFSGWGVHNCAADHSEDAGVRCFHEVQASEVTRGEFMPRLLSKCHCSRRSAARPALVEVACQISAVHLAEATR